MTLIKPGTLRTEPEPATVRAADILALKAKLDAAYQPRLALCAECFLPLEPSPLDLRGFVAHEHHLRAFRALGIQC